jgi:hypothetical protein
MAFKCGGITVKREKDINEQTGINEKHFPASDNYVMRTCYDKIVQSSNPKNLN